MTTRVKGILFDLGDTILDFGHVDILGKFEAGAHLAYQYLQGLGLELPPFSKFFRRQLWAIRWNYFKSRFTRKEFNTLLILGGLSVRMGHDLTHQQTQELAWKWYQPLSEQATVEPGTRELLEEFRQAGLKLGIVSNTFVPGTILDRHLEQENLLDLLPLRIYSCDVRYRKPHQNIFQLALDRSGLQPGQTLFVGDSLGADISGANNSGMISVLKDPAGRHLNARVVPAHRIKALGELRQIVQQYNS